jgi:hypothetical protein
VRDNLKYPQRRRQATASCSDSLRHDELFENSFGVFIGFAGVSGKAFFRLKFPRACSGV